MYLRGFAGGERVWVYDREKSEYREQGIADTAVQRDYYAVIDASGAKNRDFEGILAGIEGNTDLIAAVREAGYELGFASHGGMNMVGNSRAKPLHFSRIALDYGTPMSLFRGTLALPRLVLSR